MGRFYREFEQSVGNSEGQESLECCSPLDRKESDASYRVNNNSNWENELFSTFLCSHQTLNSFHKCSGSSC